MGLLDAFKQYVKDAMPGGLLNAEWTPQNVRNAGEAMSMIPKPIGDVASGLLAIDDVRKGDYGSAALNGVGLLPFVPAMGGMTKNIVNRALSQTDLSKLPAELVNRLRGVDESYRLPNLAQAVPSEYLPAATKSGAKTVKVYRGVPNGVAEIRPGDWVAIDRGYAAQHGGAGNKVISMEVPADHVGWAGTDMNEYFYLPRIAD